MVSYFSKDKLKLKYKREKRFWRAAQTGHGPSSQLADS
jgi:hypothetical protein